MSADSPVVVVRTSTQINRDTAKPSSPTVVVTPTPAFVEMHDAPHLDDVHHDEAPHAERTSLTLPRLSVNRARFAKEEAAEADLQHHHGHSSGSVFKRIFMYGFLTMNSLGIVYGDIGTSPLYVFTVLFEEFKHEPAKITPDLVLGGLSLILYALIVICTIKYIIFILSADNQGEGGVFALSALPIQKLKEMITEQPKSSLTIGRKILRMFCIILSIIGAAFIIGDGCITPPISVLSAMEGIKTYNPSIGSWVVPTLAAVILFVLFLCQRFGTAKVGLLFGPVTLCWCVCLFGTGVYNVSQNPTAFLAFNPAYAFNFLFMHGTEGFKMLGSVVLAITGCEAMYADMGHFGVGPIRIAWMLVVLPSIAFSYLGQAAVFLVHPEKIHGGAFFNSVPAPVFWPCFVFATLATVIASQAMITGSFSLISQAINLGRFPRIKIYQTSKSVEGQIYIPMVNFGLMIVCIALVLIFQSSEALASAYGLAVCFDLFITDIFFVIMILICLRIPIILRIPLAIVFGVIFMPISGAFLAANITKFIKGGWIPIAIGIASSGLMLVWKFGSTALRQRMKSQDTNITYEQLNKKILPTLNVVKSSAGVFVVPNKILIPAYMNYLTDLMKVMPETIIFLTVKCFKVPIVPPEKRMTVENVGPHMYRVVLRYGFYESKINVQDLLIDTYLIPEITPANKPASNAPQQTDTAVTTSVVDSNQAATNSTQATSAPPSPVVPKEKVSIFSRIKSLCGAADEDDEEYKATSIPLIYYMPRDRPSVNRKNWFFARWPASLFILLHRNSRNDLTGILDLPADRIIEVGTQVYL